MSLKITVLSGGSGNDALIKGLKTIYSKCDVKVITNLYDSGKSTGICRKVTDTLGVSDVRKNHIRMYKATNSNCDRKILEFYDNRYDLTKGNELNEVLDLLKQWNLYNDLGQYAVNFFNRESSRDYEYNDFSIANIIYSEMYAEIGYEITNSYFCNLLNIDDFVICSSFDNVYLKAKTENGYIIDDEGELVDYCNPDNKIVDTFYDGTCMSINQAAIHRILNSDLIIISTGTFWSSIYPTLQYLDFYKYVNKSKAKKIWAINNIEDKDAYGVSSNDFIDKVSELGLNLKDFTILENLDAAKLLRRNYSKYNIVYKHMENNNGKHNGYLYAREVLRIYYNLNTKYDRIIFDFDDTIWSRDANVNPDKLKVSKDNIMCINKLSNFATIISGNTFSSIADKLYSVFGTELEDFNVEVWADANSRRYIKNDAITFIELLEINQSDFKNIRDDLMNRFNLNCTIDNKDNIANIKIKPLKHLERLLLQAYLNEYKLKNTNYIAKISGISTIDIVHRRNDKLAVFDYCNFKDCKTLYIGDEIDSGNDIGIAKSCTNYINVSSIYETSALLKLIGELYE